MMFFPNMNMQQLPFVIGNFYLAPAVTIGGYRAYP